MTIFAFPDIPVNASSWQIVSNTKIFVSSFTRTVQTAARNGTGWVVTLGFPPLKDPNRQIMQGWLAQLNGQEHRFYLHDHTYTARGTLAGTPLVKGADQVGVKSLDTDGWDNSSLVLRQGDQIEVGGELKMVTADVTSDGAGGTTVIPISPETHTAPADDSAIVVVQPKGIFMLSDSAQGWDNKPGIFTGFNLNAVEDLLA